ELIYAGLIPGYMQGMEEDVVGLEVGDLQIHAPGYLEKPSIYTAIPDAQAVSALSELGLVLSRDSKSVTCAQSLAVWMGLAP
ncbi:MAG TPA: hypothetical protein PKY30_25445, partial [Myxococcota bacterium]|nr:hypothetical protein [Myxococcota bacterium]